MVGLVTNLTTGESMFSKKDREVTETRATTAPQGTPAAAPPGTPHTYSFDELCVPLYDEMVRFANRLTCDDHARAADIVQDSMVKAMQAWPRWAPYGDPASYARAWLYRIVNNTFVKRYHSGRVLAKRHENLRGDIINATVQQKVESFEHLCDSPIGDEIVSALGALSIDHRQVVMLHYVDGLDCDAIARELGVPRNTVFTRLARARATLERLLAQYAEKQYGIKKVAAAAASAAPTAP